MVSTAIIRLFLIIYSGIGNDSSKLNDFILPNFSCERVPTIFFLSLIHRFFSLNEDAFSYTESRHFLFPSLREQRETHFIALCAFFMDFLCILCSKWISNAKKSNASVVMHWTVWTFSDESSQIMDFFSTVRFLRCSAVRVFGRCRRVRVRTSGKDEQTASMMARLAHSTMGGTYMPSHCS